MKDDESDDIEEFLCVAEFPELAKTNYMTSGFTENGSVSLKVEVRSE